MTLHFQECLNLRKGQVLSITQCHQFIECAQQLEGIAEDFPLIQALANAGGHLGEQMKTVDILKDIRLTVGDQDNVQLIQWLIDEADVVLFNGGVLGPRICKLGKGGKKSLNARPGDFTELTREDRFASASTYRCC